MDALAERTTLQRNVLHNHQSHTNSEVDVAWSALRSAKGEVVSARRGDTLVGAGAPAEHCFFVLEGALRVWRPLADGRRQILAFAFPGDWVGVGELREHNASVEAVAPARAERYPLRSLAAAAAADAGAAAALRDLLRAGLEAAQGRILVLGHRNTREKLASFLLEMSDRLAAGGDAVDLPMPRHDIGDYLGMSPETVCRNFTQLVADGVVALPGPNRVRVLRRELLEFIGLWP